MTTKDKEFLSRHLAECQSRLENAVCRVTTPEQAQEMIALYTAGVWTVEEGREELKKILKEAHYQENDVLVAVCSTVLSNNF